MKTSPCFQCQERRPGCHPECGAYLAWKEESEQRREERNRATAADRDAVGFRMLGARRAEIERHKRKRK